MTDWQIFKVVDQMNAFTSGRSGYHLTLDRHVKFSDGYYKNVYTHTLPYPRYSEWIEIDLDRTKNMYNYDIIHHDWWRTVPREVGIASAMTNVSSVDATALAVTREGIDRVNRGEISEFEYKMVDNSGNKHQWIYKK